MDIKWEKFRNGTDIRGVALEGVEGESVNLTEEVVNIIGASFGVWLSNKKNKNFNGLKISVGTDSRLSAEKLKNALIKGLTDLGCEVYDCGMASTPAMFMTTILEEYNFDGAIMVTASHLPFNRNGMKFFTKEGGVEKENIVEVLSIAEENDFAKVQNKGEVKIIDFISVYCDILVNKIREGVNDPVDKLKPLRDFKIIVDAGNGAGGFFVDKVLKPLGADTTGSQFIEPDGRFPNHIPNPEEKEAMASIQKAVLENHADLGIIFDTDVDRAAVVDGEGNEINRNRLIALISSVILEEHPNSIIVTDSITSNGLKTFIEERLGGVHHRFKRGYKNVINEAIRLNKEGKECCLAIETSGHAALKENYFLDDGAYLIAKILIKMAKIKLEENKSLHSLIKELEEPLESLELRMKIKSEDFKAYGNKIIEDLESYCETEKGWHIIPNNYEGIRVACDKEVGDGWFLLRLSLHDPVMPLNIESDSEEGIKFILSKLLEFLSKYKHIDFTAVNSYLNLK
ncbi:phosphomannomutase/phosphoglucomutase [Clostridium ganghwense]|uniref:Phosphomannomutase/phosphoglucomutase n=1 Tax=Clostridium ganghwense TaxID=312089 RepID=A0ABT4CQQ8_9CLOT|nr:phosphomannomutase/phosphoglucomutase [Clostridium ganghwense]MCY6371391.1 phosphomannomutase/phosphoglucomutase [Clostridium ganghwense]